MEYTTFDCVCELEKIAAGYPAFKCVLRIRCDDADAKINLGLKYGADLSDVPMLLGMARHLGLQVRGDKSMACVEPHVHAGVVLQQLLQVSMPCKEAVSHCWARKCARRIPCP